MEEKENEEGVSQSEKASVSERAKASVRKIASFANGLSATERLIIIFAIGIVIGYGVKLTVRDTLTIGYDDYTLKGSERSYDLLEMEKRQKEEVESASTSGEAAAVTDSGATCQ
jgi:hypothetical protein